MALSSRWDGNAISEGSWRNEKNDDRQAYLRRMVSGFMLAKSDLSDRHGGPLGLATLRDRPHAMTWGRVISDGAGTRPSCANKNSRNSRKSMRYAPTVHGEYPFDYAQGRLAVALQVSEELRDRSVEGSALSRRRLQLRGLPHRLLFRCLSDCHL